jgi:hypothetical protein
MPPLPASAIRVYEDGEPVDPAESGLAVRGMRPSLRASVLVLIDLSGSVVAADHLEDVRITVLHLLESLAGAAVTDTGPFVEIGVQAFATRAEPMREIIPFSSCPAALDILRAPGALEAWRPVDTATDLYGSMVEAAHLVAERGAGPTPDTRGLLVLVSDGRDTVGTTASSEALAETWRLDGTWALAVGDQSDFDALSTLAGSGSVARLPAWEVVAGSLRARVLEWRERSLSRYLLGYCSPKGGGTHDITLSASVEGQAVELRVGPLRFDATGFVPGCVPGFVANPCAWGTADEHVCGAIDGIPCGTCGTLARCATCDVAWGTCVSP